MFSFCWQSTDSRTALQPTFGKLYKVFNVKYVFLIAVTLFESISALRDKVNYSRIINLRCRAYICRSHYRPCHCWLRRSGISPTFPAILMSGNLLGRVYGNCIYCPSSRTTYVFRFSRRRQCYCIRRWASPWRSIVLSLPFPPPP